MLAFPQITELSARLEQPVPCYRKPEAVLAGNERDPMTSKRKGCNLPDPKRKNRAFLLVGNEEWPLQQSNPSLDSEARRQMKTLVKHVSDIGTEVQAISHRLHSSKLEILGLVAACRSFCREVAERNKVIVDFTEEGTPRGLPHDVSLCLFRILQESLNNAIKHSGAQPFEVRLRGVSDEIQLTVRDWGVGFDAQAALSGDGLGLISMRERASLVKGTITITSKPMAGTEISLRVPIEVNRQLQAIS
jgi:signal transduction histidine kinase